MSIAKVKDDFLVISR